MQYRPLGNTGLYVSQLCLGCMTFSKGDQPTDVLIGTTGVKLAETMVNRALDAGVNFFDTANMYSRGQSEELLGKALGARRQDAIIATKVHFPFSDNPNALGQGRVAIYRELEASLRRLGTDYIDLYQVHSFDATTPIEETMTTLNDVVRAGKVRYIGLSNFAAWQIAQANGIAERRGFEKFCSVQAYYSLAGRELEREILPAARALGLGVMVWSPLAGGFLSGKYTQRDGAGEVDEGRRTSFTFPPVHPERGDAIVGVLRDIAGAHDVSPARVALAWLLHQDGVSSVIIGARKLHQLEDNLKAAELELSAEELKRLDEVSALAPEYPNWMPAMPRGMTLEKAWGLS